MELYDLVKRLRVLETDGTNSSMGAGDSSSGVGNSATGATDSSASMAECGDEMDTAHSEPSHVSMSVSMSGQGKGGIRDLIDVLRNIEGGTDDSAEPIEIPGGNVDTGSDDAEVILGDEFKNAAPDSSGTHEFDLEKVVNPPSDDFSANTGDHRMRQTGLPIAHPVNEELVNKLQNLYNDIKLREGISINHRLHAGNPKVSRMEHHGHGEFTCECGGQPYSVYAPIDFGTHHTDVPKWLGSLTIKNHAGESLHHSHPAFMAIDEELSKMDPRDLEECYPAPATDPVPVGI